MRLTTTALFLTELWVVLVYLTEALPKAQPFKLEVKIKPYKPGKTFWHLEQSSKSVGQVLLNLWQDLTCRLRCCFQRMLKLVRPKWIAHCKNYLDHHKAQWLIARKHVPQKFITKNVFSLELMEQLLPNLDRSLFWTTEFTTEIRLKFKGHRGQTRPGFWPSSWSLYSTLWTMLFSIPGVDLE